MVARLGVDTWARWLGHAALELAERNAGEQVAERGQNGEESVWIRERRGGGFLDRFMEEAA